MSVKKNLWTQIVLTLVIFCLGVIVGARFFVEKERAAFSLTENRDESSSFEFISPLLACESESSATSQGTLLDLQNTLRGLVERKKGRARLSRWEYIFANLNMVDGSA